MDGCVRERFLVVDGFLADEHAGSMREDIDAHFANPGQHQADTHQVWNYWHVPGSYTYLRTAPEKVIAREKVEQFVSGLRNWAARNLGLAGITWPYLSLHVPGCVQGLHNDSTNGRLGYVYSLTRDDRRTLGGETVLMHERDLFRSSLDAAAAGTDLFDLIQPRFNRLTLFDDRIPHAVQRLDGPMDPREGRFVLHGHISEAGIVVQGALSPDDIQSEIVSVIDELRETNAKEVHGPFVVSVEIDPDGKRLVWRQSWTGSPATMALTSKRSAPPSGALRFPASVAPTRANIPLTF
jgi:hypothetical protein